MITNRTLQQWRRDALISKGNPLLTSDPSHPEKVSIAILAELEYCERILRLTQELMDLNLLRKGKS